MSRGINWEYVYERPLTPHKCSGWPQRSLEADYQPLNNCFTKLWKLLIFFSKISKWRHTKLCQGLVFHGFVGLWASLPCPQIPYPPQVQLGPNLVCSSDNNNRRPCGWNRIRWTRITIQGYSYGLIHGLGMLGWLWSDCSTILLFCLPARPLLPNSH